MSETPAIECLLRDLRTRRHWSQEEVSRRSGLSRAGVSAIETGRLVPSTAAALALASAFDCRVEDLFRLAGAVPEGGIAWAWPPRRLPCRYWLAEVGGRTWAYPVEVGPGGETAHDGVAIEGHPLRPGAIDPGKTLVVACCDPAVGLLAEAYTGLTGFRLLVLPRSSGRALDLLGKGLVHVAGTHLATDEEPEANVGAAREHVARAISLVRLARWEEGLALAPGVAARSVGAALRARLSWVGREPGSGARRCLDQLRPGLPEPRRIARDHRGVAEAIRSGWAQAGVCIRLASEEAGLDFLGVRSEHYDLCILGRDEEAPRIRALIGVVRSGPFRSVITELPGYDTSGSGEIRRIDGPR
jgi:molybdate-binding protein/transcriptional regulator with XRE-family HTH domain